MSAHFFASLIEGGGPLAVEGVRVIIASPFFARWFVAYAQFKLFKIVKTVDLH